MLEMLNMMILAAVQGLTEFLPVSSSGHLVLMQTLLQTRKGDIFFDVMLHLGTLGSIVAVYRHEILRLLKLDGAAIRYVLALALATLPAVVVGLLFKDSIEALFLSPVFAAGGLLVTAAVLFSTRFAAEDKGELPEPWVPVAPRLDKAFLIGCSQAFSILPGVSRSGSTIATSLWMGLPRAEAARFSFLMSVPAILGAAVLQMADHPVLEVPWYQMALAALVAFAMGLLALRWTALAVVQAHFWKFSIYCAALGLVVLIVLR